MTSNHKSILRNLEVGEGGEFGLCNERGISSRFHILFSLPLSQRWGGKKLGFCLREEKGNTGHTVTALWG